MSGIKGNEDLTTAGSKNVTVTEDSGNIGLDVYVLNPSGGGGTEATAANQVIGNDKLDQLIGAATADMAWDYQEITYVGATTDVSTVTYKTGGAAGTTVRVLTFGYDGSNRITSITKSV